MAIHGQPKHTDFDLPCSYLNAEITDTGVIPGERGCVKRLKWTPRTLRQRHKTLVKYVCLTEVLN